MLEHEYLLYYYSKLGTQRKPSVRNLLIEQKDNIVYNFRRVREASRRTCNCIYLSDIGKYCMIMATLVNNSDTSIGAVILDDDKLLAKLNLRAPEDIVNYTFKDHHRIVEHEPPAKSGLSLDEINRIRMAIKSQSKSHAYIQPMTEEQYNTKIIIEYLTIPKLQKSDFNKRATPASL